MAMFPASLLFDPSIFFSPFFQFNYYCYLQRQPWHTFDDNFMMYSFKVKRCLDRRAHNWGYCPYVHQGERIQRRDPCKFQYKRQMCHESQDITMCRLGNRCKYSHGLYEYWLHPTRYRTRMCNMGLACRRRVCFFAHSLQQLRSVDLLPDYGAYGDGQFFPLLRDPPCHTLGGCEAGETSGTSYSYQRMLDDRSNIGEAAMNWHMDMIIMKLLEELDEELV
ncbi:zinc finger CCCH domain-containing protein 54 [Carex littledalei]|uniref:Zinc finger CCCH domain-containing protein 54 n=1 Tax=Carex littledalei TaxID=544730 RepID=A0A833QS65_9POAL|nr:zinc finger CCCH domain-containing protein 54 [Carex littledalei]